ncbi:uncharacterized protein DSM5745_04516 [Aspergillus mulundensis]|uniref:CorA-like transporter domain-containing protein n=1 Tax=Aspergillus mulundensis TaxID=1810919 RepID=A0A3D8SCX5_9EURO|nr:hypothetical protein DSM5745_04516 [Aspergillus mulundensis]RDW84190.1 hypothetical protein DSM5745_04516 [Aspergillus mulundensis]
MTEISAEFDGWSSYPRNLGLSAAVDAKGYDRRLVQAEKRLFADEDSDDDSDGDENVAQMLELGPVCQDIGYNVKYVAAHGRSFPKDPYSVRETGVYHGFDAAAQQTQWVFIQASQELQERMRGYFTRPEESHAEAQIGIHGIIFQTASQAWREYLVYLEGTFAKMASIDSSFSLQDRYD